MSESEKVQLAWGLCLGLPYEIKRSCLARGGFVQIERGNRHVKGFAETVFWISYPFAGEVYGAESKLPITQAQLEANALCVLPGALADLAVIVDIMSACQVDGENLSDRELSIRNELQAIISRFLPPMTDKDDNAVSKDDGDYDDVMKGTEKDIREKNIDPHRTGGMAA